MKRRIFTFLMILTCIIGLTTGCEEVAGSILDEVLSSDISTVISLDEIPEYDGSEYVVINDNVPSFTEEELTKESYEKYSSLDSLNRCGVAEACIGTDIMPTEERGAIGMIKPSGWKMAKYDIVDGKYLYNRCHLIGYQLTGENANEENLITGTRYLNVEGMLPFENQVADYVEETDNHVLYRVTPIFEEDNLVASGVQMEAMSVEDEGEGVCYNVYVYNVQPGIVIDYATGESYEVSEGDTSDDNIQSFILNTSSKKIHYPTCSSVADTKSENKERYKGTIESLYDMGYEPCGRCNPS